MKRGFTAVLMILAAMSLSGCSTIQTYQKVRQPVGTTLVASVGSVLFRMDKLSDLPNVVGKADIYGGKIDNGFTEVRLVSINGETRFTLAIRDIDQTSTETVLDRYGPGKVNVQQTVNVSGGNNSDPTVSIDFEKVKVFAVGGYVINFILFDGVNLSYSIRKQ